MAGLEPEFPLWLGLVSLPLTFLGDPCWFLPSGLTAAEERETTALGGGAEATADGRLDGRKPVPRPLVPTGLLALSPAQQ